MLNAWARPNHSYIWRNRPMCTCPVKLKGDHNSLIKQRFVLIHIINLIKCDNPYNYYNDQKVHHLDLRIIQY